MNMVEKPFHAKHIALRREADEKSGATVTPDSNMNVQHFMHAKRTTISTGLTVNGNAH